MDALEFRISAQESRLQKLLHKSQTRLSDAVAFQPCVNHVLGDSAPAAGSSRPQTKQSKYRSKLNAARSASSASSEQVASVAKVDERLSLQRLKALANKDLNTYSALVHKRQPKKKTGHREAVGDKPCTRSSTLAKTLAAIDASQKRIGRLISTV